MEAGTSEEEVGPGAESECCWLVSWATGESSLEMSTAHHEPSKEDTEITDSSDTRTQEGT